MLRRIPLLAATGWTFIVAGGLASAIYGAVDFDLSRPSSRTDGLPLAPPPVQLRRYVASIIVKYDVNGDGQLQTPEWKHMQGDPQRIDSDTNGVLTADELLRHAVRFAADKKLVPGVVPRQRDESSNPSAASSVKVPAKADEAGLETGKKAYHVPERFLPQGLPEWFRARDLNGDAQLSLGEYAPTGEAQRASEFARLDANRDGLITAKEAIRDEPRETSKSTDRSGTEKPRPVVDGDGTKN